MSKPKRVVSGGFHQGSRQDISKLQVVGPPTGGPRVLLSRAGGMAIFGRSSPRVAPSSQSFSASRCISIFMPTQLSWLAIFRIYGSVRRARK